MVAEGKETREFDGRPYIMERALKADFALVKAWKGDTWGNLVYRKTARNFNPMMATAAQSHDCGSRASGRSRRTGTRPDAHPERLCEANFQGEVIRKADREENGEEEPSNVGRGGRSPSGQQRPSDNVCRRQCASSNAKPAQRPRKARPHREAHRRASCATDSTSTSASACRRWSPITFPPAWK